MTPIRPKFSNPPLIERAISVHFRELSGFTLGDFGLFWTAIIADFPTSESVERSSPAVERFGGFSASQPDFSLMPGGALPRGFFRNEISGELIQVQPDRFTFNWIKTGPDHSYPHSEATIERFFNLLTYFEDFVKSRGMSAIEYLQCEITNVNVVPIHDVGESFADIATVIKMPDVSEPCPSLSLEHQSIGARHLMIDKAGQPFGRVYTNGQPSMRARDGDLAFRMDITARGAPLGEGRSGLHAFFEEAVSAVNGVFLASITQAGRKFWGEHDGDSIH